MRILFLFGHELVIGGHFKSANAFAKKLIHKGHKIYVMGNGGFSEKFNPFLEPHIKFIPLDKNKYDKKNFFSRFKNWILPNKSILKCIKENNIDVIHAHDFPILWDAYYTACMTKCGFIYSQAGGQFHNNYPPINSCFFVFSRELFDGYINCGFKRHEVNLISERIDNEIYKPFPVNVEFVKKKRLPQNGFVLFTAIRLHSQKKAWLDSLLKLAVVSKIKMIIMIAGNGELLSYVKDQATHIEKKKQNRVKFILLGGVNSEKELVKYINYSDIYIGNGRGLMEAMACAKPCIVFGEKEQYEFVEKENVDEISYYNFSGRHFRNNNSKKLEDYLQKIDQIMHDRNKLEELAKFSYSYATNYFSSEIGAKKLEKMYFTSLGKKSTLIDPFKWILLQKLNTKIINKFKHGIQ